MRLPLNAAAPMGATVASPCKRRAKGMSVLNCTLVQCEKIGYNLGEWGCIYVRYRVYQNHYKSAGGMVFSRHNKKSRRCARCICKRLYDPSDKGCCKERWVFVPVTCF